MGRSADTESDFPFIEISLEDDITTVVGANESGKSHLLSAISKVLTGQGIPEFDNATSTYSRTDLCHYTSPRSKNAEDWPNIGLQFKDITQEELQAVGNAIGQQSLGKTSDSTPYVFTLVIAPDNEDTEAYVYLNGAEARIELDKTKLTELRR